MRRLTIALFGIVATATISGCFGPVNNRLYSSDWKGAKAHPIPVYTEWTYQGEHWEHVVYKEGPGNRP
jgi:hypothetical protein